MSVHLKKREIIVKGGRNRAPRPKTFTTKDSANAYAKVNNITKFTLENLKSEEAKTAKYRIVQE